MQLSERILEQIPMSSAEMVLKEIHALQELLLEQKMQVGIKLDRINERLDLLVDEQKKLLEKIDLSRNDIVDSKCSASEAVWAEIFNNTITDSVWLKNKVFSPGRWAVGYQYLYVMYRVLNEMHPKNILELGLGQSTRMISQYVAAFENVNHAIVEHDWEWIDFFKNSYLLHSNSKIIQLEREMIHYDGVENVRVFKGFAQTFSNQQFDFISIDAPLGGDMKVYARIDVLSILPACLSPNFVIMIDDTERSGESNTVKKIKECLNRNEIKFKSGKYSGQKDCTLICAHHMGFLTSM